MIHDSQNVQMPPFGSRFRDRVAIITGSSRGIGRAIAERLGSEGAAIILNGRQRTPLAACAEQLRSTGIRAEYVLGNVAEPGIAEGLVDMAISRFSRVDFVVNNVGISPYFGPLLAIDRERFERTLTVNTWPAVALIQLVVAQGLGDGGAILNVSSIGARQVQPDVAAYTASKAALDVLTKVLARELGRKGIRVNGIAPGLVRTRTSSAISEGELGDREAEILPLARLGTPHDIACAAAFLLSDDASWITGHTLVVDGGRLLVGDEPRPQIGVFA